MNIQVYVNSHFFNKYNEQLIVVKTMQHIIFEFFHKVPKHYGFVGYGLDRNTLGFHKK